MLRFINVVYQGFMPLLQERLIFNSDANWKIHIESIITSEKKTTLKCFHKLKYRLNRNKFRNAIPIFD